MWVPHPDSPKSNISKVFEHPSDVLKTSDLSAAEKIDLLQDWETDLREILVAAEEGMAGRRDDPADQLREIHAALQKLGASRSTTRAPTKAGGS
jgi:hypothetical protein